MKYSVVLVLCSLAFMAPAQQKKVSEKQKARLSRADQLFEHGHYGEAITAYEEVLEGDRRNMEVMLKIAEASFRLPDLEQASGWYQDAFAQSETGLPETVPAHHLYNYAEILLSEEQYDEALRWFGLYKQRVPEDTRSERRIRGIASLHELKKDASQYSISVVSFNSAYPDFSPSFYDSGLVFVSGRREAAAEKEKKDARGTYLDLYYTKTLPDSTFSSPIRISNALNTDFHEGPAVFYDDGRKVIFTRNNLNDKLRRSEEAIVIHLQLFAAEKDASGKTWKTPVLLAINNKDYSIGHPAISSDGLNLYFSSNKPGGYGGTDLYVSRWVNNTWSAPENLGAAVNTEGNEMFPFVAADTTLYFASNGHAGFGGLDIYRYNLAGTTEVKNMGHPVNSSKDDFGLILDAKTNTGYFSSNRQDINGDRNDNIYRLSIDLPLPQASPAPVVVQAETADPDADVYYTIQIFALRRSEVIRRSLLQDLKQVLLHEGKDGFNRYTYGKYSSIQGAIEMLQKIRAMGYNDAFVRREARYTELSKKPGIEVEKLYKH
ncbi:PD40 domain-containing protein [Fulvivirgaceae bacterium PWU4]|uniref:PD40 domain-containing protein n=1 Tax=Chryseosolibacter histidini TaxID=2782349 RepID=A0AAP2GR67_9BACT|nr:hypothetical protein [Chryseosolibacter histidini]MBT1699262.1 PD40 domain-containing protein [Chryseosolibacter histidini]